MGRMYQYHTLELFWNGKHFKNFQTNKEKDINFIIEPYIRFEGKPGEQATMFFKDPSGNALEFKSFKDFNQIFAKDKNIKNACFKSF